MATIKAIKRKKRTAYQIGFTVNGIRSWLSLGSNYGKEDVQEIALVIDKIVASISSGLELESRTKVWLEHAPEDLRERLDKAGLIESTRTPTLGEVIDAYWELEVPKLGERTARFRAWSVSKFFEFVSPTTKLDAFSKRDALSFVNQMQSKYAEATVATIVRDLKRVFRWASEVEITNINPFEGVKKGSFKNKSREYYVPMSDYFALLDACPSRMSRVLISLYRIGGLRAGEALLLQWPDVDFARGRILVHSPKTARHADKDSRVVPMFPLLRQELEAYWDSLPEGGSPYLITEYRTTLNNHVERIVFYAGLNRWERLIQNMRSSRAIEIAREYGVLAEAEWIGHSPQTAKDHYLHVLDADFERAATVDNSVPKEPEKKTTTKTTTQLVSIQR